MLNDIYERLEFVKFTVNQIKNESFLSLFNGLTSAVWLAVVQNSTYFCWSKIFSIVFEKFKFSNTIANSMLMSLLAAIITSICINPVSVVNARMTMSAEHVKFNIMTFRLEEEAICK